MRPAASAWRCVGLVRLFNMTNPRRTLTAALIATSMHASLGVAQAAKPFPATDSLKAITERGIALAKYDAAAWRASDAVMALHPSAEEIAGYVALPTSDGWRVAFGRFTATRDTFLVAYEARQVPTNPDSFVVSVMRPVQAHTGDIARAARAIAVARADFGTPNRPYNFAVLPAGAAEWHVYAMPAQTRSDVWPLGGDVRYVVSGDGRSILGKRRLHNQILEVSRRAAAGADKLVAGTHSAVLDDIPEDTDVFHVLVRRPSVPEFIVTDAFMYRIEPDGAIRLLGRRAEILGR
jgi:hypothetical protein